VLEIIVRVKDETSPRPIKFEELYAIKDSMVSLTLLWDTNCYSVNIDRRYFCINGGRKIAIKTFRKCTDLSICYRKRNSIDLSFGAVPDKRSEPQVTYLIGFEGTVDGELCRELIHISPDGATWIWKKAL